MTDPVRVGISTCPNDVFAFHALLSHRVDTDPPLRFEFADIQALNERIATGKLDVAKVSFFAALRMSAEVVVLRPGAALGFGVGPVLLAAPHGGDGLGSPRWHAPTRGARVLCPGEWTTATLLYRLFHGVGHVSQGLFSRIMPRLARGEADFGVAIHEGRFTYADYGLHLVEDLGATWESRTGVPIPLGGIVARRSVPAATIQAVQRAIRASLEYAVSNRRETLTTMRKYAQELDDAAIWSHVDLYVNDHTLDIGEAGANALAELERRARAGGLAGSKAPLEIASWDL